jgi:hypothetical protein
MIRPKKRIFRNLDGQLSQVAEAYKNRRLRELTTSCASKLKRYSGIAIHHAQNYRVGCRLMLENLDLGTIPDQTIENFGKSHAKPYAAYIKMLYELKNRVGINI